MIEGTAIVGLLILYSVACIAFGVAISPRLQEKYRIRDTMPAWLKDEIENFERLEARNRKQED